MNKSAYILIALFTWCISSCSDENDIFDSSSAHRMSAMLQECNDVLTGAENGWVLEYYPEDSKYGGFYLYMTFSKQGEVKVTAESPMLESPGEQVTSMYQMKADMGPVLSFDTYNRILHQFSDPNPDGLGYEGDYEFVILNATKEKVELRGKKSGAKMQMTPLPTGTTWESYSNKLDKMIQSFPGFTMRMNIDGTVVEMEESYEIGRYQSFKLPEGVESSAEGMAYIYTPDGIKFKEPVTIAGKTIQNFIASEDGTHLVCTDEGANGVEIVQMPLGEAFVTKKGNWFFDTKQMGPRFTTMWSTTAENMEKDLTGQGPELLQQVSLLSPNQAFVVYSYSINDEQLYSALFYMDFIPIEGADQMKIIFTGAGDDFARYFYMEYFKMILGYISDDEPYSMTYDNLKCPSEITFRRNDNPDVVWFKTVRFIK
ncbi:DUF4302 domain-containing protein [Bacteroides sp.]